MGGAETTGAPVRRPLRDAHRAPPVVNTGTSGEGSGGSSGGRGRDVGAIGEVDRNQIHERGHGVGEGEDKVGYGVGANIDVILVRSTCGAGDRGGGGPDPERWR